MQSSENAPWGQRRNVLRNLCLAIIALPLTLLVIVDPPAGLQDLLFVGEPDQRSTTALAVSMRMCDADRFSVEAAGRRHGMAAVWTRFERHDETLAANRIKLTHCPCAVSHPGPVAAQFNLTSGVCENRFA